MAPPKTPPYEVRCPMHGSIPFNERERAIIDHPLMQRLRSISQLGFAHLVYPGATHTRFSHALGVMHLAGRIFDGIRGRAAGLLDEAFPPEALDYCRQVLRFAGLLHDLGHLPFSHSFERLLPERGSLSLPEEWFGALDSSRPTRHEDLSVAMVHALAQEDGGLLSLDEARDVCALIHDEIGPGPGLAEIAVHAPGRDPYPLLKQIVSGEIDADRMDYLPRDAHFAGVTYGYFDLDRLVRSLSCAESERGLVMALDQDAVFTYENFLMARFHMAMQVYFHKTLLPFDYFLEQAVREGEVELPFDGSMESLLDAREDVLMARLHAANGSRWASRIVERRPVVRLYRLDEAEGDERREAIQGALAAAGIETIHIREKRRLSTLGSPTAGAAAPILVREQVLGSARMRPLEEVSLLLQRYNRTFVIENFYCDPADYPRAVEALRGVVD